LQHIVGFTASGTRRANKDNRLFSWKCINFFLEFTDRNIDRRLEMAGGKFVRVPHIDQINALWIFFQNFSEGLKVNRSFLSSGLDGDCSWRCTVCLCPGRVPGIKDLYIGVSKLARLPGGLMAQLSGVTLTVKDHQHIFIGRQFALQLVKFTVWNADGRGDMPFVIFRFFRSGVYENCFICQQLAGHILDGHRCIAALGFHIAGKTVGKDFDIRITEFFRLPGGIMAELSGGPAAIED